MWKLAIVLCATAAFFASTKAQPSRPIPKDHHEKDDVPIPGSELISAKTSLTPMIKLENGLEVVINETLKMIKSFVDDLISWGKQHGSFDEEECRSLYSSYNDLMTEVILNVTKSASSQVFHEVSLEFAKMLAEVNGILRELPAKLSTDPKMTVQKIYELSRSYYGGFNLRTVQFLIQFESMLNGEGIGKIVRRYWDMMINAVPDVIKKTYDCVTRSLSVSDNLAKTPAP